MLVPGNLDSRLSVYDGRLLRFGAEMRERSKNGWLLDYPEHERLHRWLEARSCLRKQVGGRECARVLSGVLDWLGSRLVAWGEQLRARASGKEPLGLNIASLRIPPFCRDRDLGTHSETFFPRTRPLSESAGIAPGAGAAALQRSLPHHPAHAREP
jgi:hypothetical protein